MLPFSPVVYTCGSVIASVCRTSNLFSCESCGSIRFKRSASEATLFVYFMGSCKLRQHTLIAFSKRSYMFYFFLYNLVYRVGWNWKETKPAV